MQEMPKNTGFKSKDDESLYEGIAKRYADRQERRAEILEKRSSERQERRESKGIGDLNSSAMGTGARFNTGKPHMELLPLRAMWQAMRLDDRVESEWKNHQYLLDVLEELAEFQERSFSGGVLHAIAHMRDDAWEEAAQVLDFGRRKYAEWNWAKGMAWSVPLACAVRHIRKILIEGEALDKDSGLKHEGHVMCNLLFLQTYQSTYPEGDDRPVAGLLASRTAQGVTIAWAAAQSHWAPKLQKCYPNPGEFNGEAGSSNCTVDWS